MRVVADTNVLVSGALWPGPSHRIIELAEAGEITLCVTEPILDELKGVLQRRKFEARLRRLRTSPEEILAGLLPLVELYQPVDASGSIPFDPDDEMFIACAVSAGAAFINSGDTQEWRNGDAVSRGFHRSAASAFHYRWPKTCNSAARTLPSWMLPSAQSVTFSGSLSWSPA